MKASGQVAMSLLLLTTVTSLPVKRVEERSDTIERLVADDEDVQLTLETGTAEEIDELKLIFLRSS